MILAYPNINEIPTPVRRRKTRLVIRIIAELAAEFTFALIRRCFP